MSNDKCPKCGSPRIDGEILGWSCGSNHYSANFFQSDYCSLIVRHRRLVEAVATALECYSLDNVAALRKAAGLEEPLMDVADLAVGKDELFPDQEESHDD